MKFAGLSTAAPAALVLTLLGGCGSEPTLPPGSAVTASPPTAGGDVARQVVMRGTSSDATASATQLAARGDSAFLHALEEGRRLSIQRLDSSLRAPRTLPRPTGPNAVQVGSGEDVLLDVSTLGYPQVHSANTAIAFTQNGTVGSATSQVAFSGTNVTIKLKYHTENTVGSRSAVSETESEVDRSGDVNSQVQCIVSHTSNPSVCGVYPNGAFTSYSEYAVPNIQVGQPCGAKIVARTSATAHWGFSLLGQIIDVISSEIKWKMNAPSFSSSPFTEPDKSSTNATCVPPAASASFGGDAHLVSGNSYSATIYNGANTASVALSGSVTNSPLPSGLKYKLNFDGADVATESYLVMNVGPGSHNLTVTVTDTLLGQYSTSQATLNVGCAAAGEGEAYRAGPTPDRPSASITPRVVTKPSLLTTCGDNGGSPGGGSEPPGGDSPNCQWVRYYIIYSDGSWSWLGPWERECDGDEMLLTPTSTAGLRSMQPVGSGNALVAPKPASTTLSVRLVAGGRNPSGRAVELHRSRAEDVPLLISVDTTLATPADIEGALDRLEVLNDRPGSDHLAAVVGAPSGATKQRAAGASRSAKYLSDLLKAGERQTSLKGRARTLDVSVDRKSPGRKP